MKAVVYDAPGRFSVRQVPVPDPGPGEVRVRVQQSGICGRDLHIHHGKFFAEFPLTPGHELVGPVDALGDGVGGVPLTRSGGTVLFYGVTEPEDLVRVSPYDVFRREITIKGSFAEINSFPAAIAALRTGRARTEGLITHRFKLDDYARALDALRSDRTVHKIIIEC
jgi:threonine dehydrogenase-like Zn-dependent dehydrogenase